MIRCIFYLLFLGSISCCAISDMNKRLWLIRHCDKPEDQSSPCCSEIGYKRASSWSTFFMKHISKDRLVEVYSSNFNLAKICTPLTKYIKPDDSCQKSQRMFLTAYNIHKALTNTSIPSILYNNYCIGDYEVLLDNILLHYQTLNIKDAIIVWEHNEIIDIIRYFDIDIPSWKNKYNNVYDIVFLIDVENQILYFDCYDYIYNTYECQEEGVYKWLDEFEHIEVPDRLQSNQLVPRPFKNVQYYFIIGLLCLLFMSLCLYMTLILLRRPSYTSI